MHQIDIENMEVDLLLQAIYLRYGYDFRGYAKASIKRRIKHRLVHSKFETISDMQKKLLYDDNFFTLLLNDMSINVTDMFRDPEFYIALRDIIVSQFAKKNTVKIWHAGCATGEEVYSMAVLLKEASLDDKTFIYATDFDENVLAKAKQGVYPVEKIKVFTKNYKDAGGLESFSNYYKAKYNFAGIEKKLKNNIHFSCHNLVTDSVFGEMDMIVCRNVLIYFSKELQDRVFKLFYDSLAKGGLLCLGSKETITLSQHSKLFIKKDIKQRIYERV